jgi:hypothetical protein
VLLELLELLELDDELEKSASLIDRKSGRFVISAF